MTPADAENNRPFPDMLRLISRRFHVPTEETMMAGDSVADPEMAGKAVATGVGFPESGAMREWMRISADALPDSLEQMVPLNDDPHEPRDEDKEGMP